MSAFHSALRLLWISTLAVLLPVTPAIAQDRRTTLTLEDSDWQVVLDNLFGGSDSGLLETGKSFDFRAEHVILTAAQSTEFFASEQSPGNLSDLVQSTLNLNGMIRLVGTIEGRPFDLTLVGHGLDIEGVTMTSDQLDTLANSLAEINGLDAMTIRAQVDGKMTVVTLEGDENFRVIQKRDELSPADPAIGKDPQDIENTRPLKVEFERQFSRGDVVRPERVDKVERVDRVDRVEKVDRVQKVERVEKPVKIEKPEHIEKPVKIEKPERPEVHKK
jgi:hypothetical protein